MERHDWIFNSDLDNQLFREYLSFCSASPHVGLTILSVRSKPICGIYIYDDGVRSMARSPTLLVIVHFEPREIKYNSSLSDIWKLFL